MISCEDRSESSSRYCTDRQGGEKEDCGEEEHCPCRAVVLEATKEMLESQRGSGNLDP